MSRRIPLRTEKLAKHGMRNIATSGLVPRLLRKQLERSKVARNFARPSRTRVFLQWALFQLASSLPLTTLAQNCSIIIFSVYRQSYCHGLKIFAQQGKRSIWVKAKLLAVPAIYFSIILFPLFQPYRQSSLAVSPRSCKPNLITVNN